MISTLEVLLEANDIAMLESGEDLAREIGTLREEARAGFAS